MKRENEVPRDDYLDSRYKRLMKSKSGKKVIMILRLLTKGIMTVREITERVDFSESEVKKIIKKSEKEDYVKRFFIEEPIRPRGKPPSKKHERTSPEKKPGRPLHYYYLTCDGLWLIRFDPEVRTRWLEVEKTYEKYVRFTLFESYANLIQAIRENPVLKEYQKPYYFMDEELQRTALNPFIYVGRHELEKVIQLYDELVGTIKAKVRSNHIANYYSTLVNSIERLEDILECHRILMDKLKKLPEVQEYIKKIS